MSQTLRSALMAGVMGTALFGCASPSHAIFHWFCPQGSTYSAARTTYAPPYLACYAPAPWTPTSGCAPCAAPVSGCAPCAAPRMSCAPVQAAYYTPQTCYRPVMTTVPVTAYRPVRSCDPCTGCPTTCFRPATTWVRQVQYMPYTSYRISYGSPCATSACASPCATGACGATMSYGGVAAPGCSSCARGAAPSSSTLTPTPQPSLNTPPAGTSTPSSGGAAPSAPPPATFRESSGSTQVDPRAKPIQSSTPARMPELTNPKNPGPTAARPVYHAAYYLVSGSQSPVTQTSAQTVVDVDGWRQARD